MANIYDLTDTWSDGNTTYTSIKMNVTNTASSAASKLIDLQVGSSSLFSVDKDGKIADATELQVDNVKVDGNTVSSTTGNLVLDPYTGSKISLDGLLWPNADGSANQMLQTDGAGNLSWGTPAAGYSNTDVDAHLNTGSATSGQTLQWNGSDYAWGTPASSYGDSDVDTHLNSSTATTGQLLSWNGTDYDWITSSAGGGSYADSDVDAHLNTSSASSGEVLGWNGTDYAWVANSGGSSYTDSDVDLHLNQSNPTSGYVLSWNGSDYAWVAQTTAAALGYTAAATTGTVTNTAGTDATLPAATTTNAGLLTGADKTKLDNIEASADVTDTANVTAAGAVMDSELADEAAVKAINQGLTTTSNVAFNDLALAGDLQVNGSTTTVGTTNMAVADSLIELSNGFTGTPVNDAGIVIERGTGDNAFIGWDESDDKFVLGTGSFDGSDTGNLTITKGDVALGTLTTAVSGTDVDVRTAAAYQQGTAADIVGGATLYNATAAITLTMDTTKLGVGDIATIYAGNGNVTIAQDATYPFTTIKIDGNTAASTGNRTIASGSLATITVVSAGVAVIAGQGVS